MATAALGGREGRLRAEVTLAVAAALGVSAACVAWPFALGLVADAVFAPAPAAGDVARAVAGHVCAAAPGAALGVLVAPPRTRRRATGAAAGLAALLALVPVGAAGVGPVAVAWALDHQDTAALAAACAGCLVLAAVVVLAARAWGARTA
jgi:hypothetical protein